MKKKLIRLTESDLQNIIENSVKRVMEESSNTISEISRGDYDNENAYRFDRTSDIQDVKMALGDFIQEKISQYHLEKDEVMAILNTMLKYFNNYKY